MSCSPKSFKRRKIGWKLTSRKTPISRSRWSSNKTTGKCGCALHHPKLSVTGSATYHGGVFCVYTTPPISWALLVQLQHANELGDEAMVNMRIAESARDASEMALQRCAQEKVAALVHLSELNTALHLRANSAGAEVSSQPYCAPRCSRRWLFLSMPRCDGRCTAACVSGPNRTQADDNVVV